VARIARRVDEGRGARPRRAGRGRGGVHRACPGSRQGLRRLRGASPALALQIQCIRAEMPLRSARVQSRQLDKYGCAPQSRRWR
jgi:hypothetical protein